MGNNTSFCKTIFFTAIFFLLSIYAAPAQSQRKLACIPIGQQDNKSTLVSDLIIEAMSTRQDIQLLEREQISKILLEHKLNLKVEEGHDYSQSVEIGKLLSADLILLIKNIPKIGKMSQSIRTRLIECKNGYIIVDRSFSIPGDDNLLEKTAQIASRHIIKSTNRIINTEDLTMIGIPFIRSQELSRKYDWLEDSIKQIVEQNLVRHKNILVLERSEVDQLMDERNLTDNLPPSLKSSAILLSGTFEVMGRGSSISIKLDARRNAKSIFSIKESVAMKDLESKIQVVTSLIVQRIVKNDLIPSMSPEKEALEIHQETLHLLKLGEFIKAYRSASAAYAIMPQNDRLRIALIHSLNQRNHVLNQGHNPYEIPKHREVSMQNRIQSNRLVLQHLDSIKNFPDEKNSDTNRFDYNFIGHHVVGNSSLLALEHMQPILEDTSLLDTIRADYNIMKKRYFNAINTEKVDREILINIYRHDSEQSSDLDAAMKAYDVIAELSDRYNFYYHNKQKKSCIAEVLILKNWQNIVSGYTKIINQHRLR